MKKCYVREVFSLTTFYKGVPCLAIFRYSFIHLSQVVQDHERNLSPIDKASQSVSAYPMDTSIHVFNNRKKKKKKRSILPKKILPGCVFPQQFAGTHIYTGVERGIVRVRCFV